MLPESHEERFTMKGRPVDTERDQIVVARQYLLNRDEAFRVVRVLVFGVPFRRQA